MNCASAARSRIKSKKIVVGEQHQATRFHTGCNLASDCLQCRFVTQRHRVVKHIGDNDEVESSSGWVEGADIALSKGEIDVARRQGSCTPHGGSGDIDYRDGF